jgi:putative ABC transport system ATP-binding protein
MAVLHVENLKKSYRSPEGDRTMVVDIDHFVVEEGQQLALQGSSGCGKTTFLNLIAGILKPDSGEILLDGHNMTKLSESGRDKVRARSLGYVFQTFNLLQGYTALENVVLGMMFGKGADRAYATQLLERVGLGDRMHYRPKQLSVGQQQRVAVARALANHPRIVLADEPTGNLDFNHAQDAMTLIREICRENNTALLLVSHDKGMLEQFETLQDLTDINKAIVVPHPGGHTS